MPTRYDLLLAEMSIELADNVIFSHIFLLHVVFPSLDQIYPSFCIIGYTESLSSFVIYKNKI